MNRLKHSPRTHPQARHRRGQSLILILFALIALIGILALTLDYGFILLARRQMQTGVNAAALEGARDINGNGRQHAADLLRNIYDDDLDPTQNDTTIGAGIDRSLIRGDGYRMMTIGEGNGLGNTLANRSSFVYRPNPQLNEGNERYGDFVQGDYDENFQPTEDQTYARGEHFTPDSEGDAFLARLRRTHNPDELDQVPGVSSSGGGLPLLIGNLAWFGATDPNARYSIRRDGVTVRATAIAQEQVAVRVWTISDSSFFQPLEYAVPSDNLTDFRLSDLLTSVGEPVGTLSPTTPPTRSGYIAVYANVSGGDRVVGFILHDPANLALRHNASPRVQDAWGHEDDMTETERSEFWQLWLTYIEDDKENLRDLLLKVPALVRSVP